MIVVFGSLNADMLFSVKAFPKPGETVLCPGYVVKPGGKGCNQAAAAARAGGDVLMVGSVGRDTLGDIPLTALEKKGVDTAEVARVGEPTAVASIMIDENGENAIVVASGANRKTRAKQITPEIMKSADVLVTQMEITAEENWALLPLAHKSGCKTILNVAPAGAVPEDVLKSVDVLVLNEGEAKTVANGLGLHSGTVEKSAAAFLKKGVKACVVTLGGKGGIVVDAKGMRHFSVLKIAPVDTTGAGDAFVGILAACLDEKLPLDEAVKRASAGAGLACLKVGAQEALPDRDAIEERATEITVG